LSVDTTPVQFVALDAVSIPASTLIAITAPPDDKFSASVMGKPDAIWDRYVTGRKVVMITGLLQEV